MGGGGMGTSPVMPLSSPADISWLQTLWEEWGLESPDSKTQCRWVQSYAGPVQVISPTESQEWEALEGTPQQPPTTTSSFHTLSISSSICLVPWEGMEWVRLEHLKVICSWNFYQFWVFVVTSQSKKGKKKVSTPKPTTTLTRRQQASTCRRQLTWSIRNPTS